VRPAARARSGTRPARTPAGIELLVARHQGELLSRQPRHEPLTGARPQVQRDDRDTGGPSGGDGAQRGIQVRRPVGQPGQHRSQEHSAGQASIGQGPDEIQPGPRGRHTRFEAGVQVLVPDRHRDTQAEGDIARRLDQQRDVAAQQRALAEDREGGPGLRKSTDDARHQAVTALGPLVRISVRAERDVLACPGRPGELLAEHVDEIGLHDHLGVEVTAGVHLQPFVRPSGEAVVADDPVRDEVARPRRDVEHGHLETQHLDRGHAQIGVALDG
jgi:hypothetical protein